MRHKHWVTMRHGFRPLLTKESYIRCSYDDSFITMSFMMFLLLLLLLVLLSLLLLMLSFMLLPFMLLLLLLLLLLLFCHPVITFSFSYVHLGPLLASPADRPTSALGFPIRHGLDPRKASHMGSVERYMFH